MCTSLSGNPCGEYGVLLQHLDQTKEVCFEGEIHRNTLEFYSQINISLWYLRGERFNFEIDCQFWCNTDENQTPPQKHELSDEEVATVGALVKKGGAKHYNLAIFTFSVYPTRRLVQPRKYPTTT